MSTLFVQMYHPLIPSTTATPVRVPQRAVDDYAARGWLEVDPSDPPVVVTPYLTQAAGDSRYVRDTELGQQTADAVAAGTGPLPGALKAALVLPLKRQLSDPQYRGAPGLMASPPTITVTNNTGPATTMAAVTNLPGQSYTSIVCDDLTKYLPLGVGAAQPVRGTVSGPQQYACSWAPTQYGAQVLRLEFLYDGTEFEVALRQFSSNQFRVMVDGEYATQYPQPLGGTPNSYGNVKVTFPGRAVRRIIFEMVGTDALFLGIWKAPTDTLRAPAPPTRRLLVAGDSYAGGSNSTALGSFPYYLGQILGFRDIINAGAGSTGWLAAGTRANLGDRLTTDVITPAPTDLVISLGHNDTGFTNAAITAQVQAVLAQIRAALPNLQSLVVTGPLFAGGNPGVYAAMGVAIQAGCAASGATYVDTTTNPIFTGTGNSGAPTGDGNSDVYIASDGVHPTDAGSAWLGYALAQMVASAVG